MWRGIVFVALACAVGGAFVTLPGHDGGAAQEPLAPAVSEATFVGRKVCAFCHADVVWQFGLQTHGQDFTQAHGRDLIYGAGGACAPCHTTGYGEPSGFQPDRSTPHLEGIGCEECHGAGSLHAAKPSRQNIHRLPQADQTCWDCHVSSYKWLRGARPRVTEATLREIALDRTKLRHPQAQLLLGEYGYEHPPEPGAHAWVSNTCVTCHLSSQPNSGSPGVATAQGEGAEPTHGKDSLRPDIVICSPCHGGGRDVAALLDRFKEEINRTLIEIGGEDPERPGHPDRNGAGGLLQAFADANGIDPKNDVNPDDPAVKAYKGARHNYTLIQAGRAVHNSSFARRLIAETRELLWK